MFSRPYQVFSGLVPVASGQGQGQGEPVCTYMLECCVRPDVEAATVLHVASQVGHDVPSMPSLAT